MKQKIAQTIDVKKIVLLQGNGNYTIVWLIDGKQLLSSATLGLYESLFEGNSFVRINRSYLVNACYIEKYQKNNATVFLTNGFKIKVSRRKKSIINNFLIRGLCPHRPIQKVSCEDTGLRS